MRDLLTIRQISDAIGAYEYRQRADNEASRWAAVAMVFRVNASNAPEVLLIKRSEHPTDPWSGHMAMPANFEDQIDNGANRLNRLGRRANSDADLLQLHRRSFSHNSQHAFSENNDILPRQSVQSELDELDSEVAFD